MLDSFLVLADTPAPTMGDPMEILSEPLNSAVSYQFYNGTGLPKLMYIVRMFGIMSCVIIIVSALLMLAVVNYPKTVMQTKTRIMTALIAVVVIALILVFADMTLSILYESFVPA